MRFRSEKFNQEPYHSYTVLRATFDRWLATQAEEAGAMLVTKNRVDEVIKENGRVLGVVTGGEKLGADVVIACDGVLSLVAEKAGLSQPSAPKNFAVGLKEVIELPRPTLEDRFGLPETKGCPVIYGQSNQGLFGGGFLYTNKSSISLGMVVGIKDLMERKPPVEVPYLLEEFKERPEIAALIRGGEMVEYSAHVIPEGGMDGLTPLFSDGLLVAGDAAGFSLNMGLTVRGMNLPSPQDLWLRRRLNRLGKEMIFPLTLWLVTSNFWNKVLLCRISRPLDTLLKLLKIHVYLILPTIYWDILENLFYYWGRSQGKAFRYH